VKYPRVRASRSRGPGVSRLSRSGSPCLVAPVFGIVFALGRFRLPAWWAISYGIAVGVGFLLSPVVQGLGVGLFGVNFGWHFAATVLTAHLAFGAAMAGLIGRNWNQALPGHHERQALAP
jgi:hypothetical protein